jgi:hypothetical protein
MFKDNNSIDKYLFFTSKKGHKRYDVHKKPDFNLSQAIYEVEKEIGKSYLILRSHSPFYKESNILARIENGRLLTNINMDTINSLIHKDINSEFSYDIKKRMLKNYKDTIFHLN